MASGFKVNLHYTRPADPSVWYAPETLAWCALLIAGPFLLAALLQRLLDDTPTSAGAEGGEGGVVMAPRATARPPLRVSPLLYLWLVMLAANTAFDIESGVLRVWASGAYGAYTTVNTAAGLPAASTLLFLPSMCLCLMATMGKVQAWRGYAWGNQLSWLGAGGLLAGVFLLMSGAPGYASVWALIGLVMLFIGLMTRASG